MEVVGLIGSILLAICSIPLAWEALRYPDSARNIPSLFLHTWTLGEIFTIIYTVYQGYWILLINYAVNLAGLTVVYWQRYLGRSNGTAWKGTSER